MSDGNWYDLGLRLLDRQVVDRDGRMVCKVDDVEFADDNDGRPYVAAILVGPRAVGPRLGGRLGRWTAAIAGRLAADRSGPPRIDARHITGIDSAVHLDRRADELDVAPLEAWVDRYVVARIPGSRHEGE